MAPRSSETAREYSSLGLAAVGQTPIRVPGVLAVAETHMPLVLSHPFGVGSRPGFPLSRIAAMGPTWPVVTL